jgi:protein pelota
VFVELEVEKTEFHRFTKTLKVFGVIRRGKPAELLPFGAAHSLSVEPGKKFRVQKQRVMEWHIARIKKAEKASHTQPVFIVLLDDEEASLVSLKEFGAQILAFMKSGKQGKAFGEEKWKEPFFEKIWGWIEQKKPFKLVLAGPAFTKEELQGFLKEKGFQSKIFLESTNSVGKTGLTELLNSQRMAKIASKLHVLREAEALEEILAEIGKNSGLAVYGENACKKALEYGALKKLAVLDEFLLEKGKRFAEFLEQAEKTRTEIVIVNAEMEPGKKLKGLGNVAGILRYKLV